MNLNNTQITIQRSGKYHYRHLNIAEGETKWRVGSYQRDTKNNAWNSWHKVPKNQEFFNLAFMGDMIFEKPLGKSKSKKSIIPYVNNLEL